MKNRFFAFFAVILASFGLFGVSKSVFAEGENLSSDVRIAKIQTECVNIKKHLLKLRSSDALKRVNLGQNYESIANDLMEKMNTRVVLNRKNAPNLISEAANFNAFFTTFKENYTNYERDLTKLSAMACSSESEAKDFSNLLEKLKTERKKLFENTSKLQELAKKYLEEVQNFSKELN